jgi:hypothetical protein
MVKGTASPRKPSKGFAPMKPCLLRPDTGLLRRIRPGRVLAPRSLLQLPAEPGRNQRRRIRLGQPVAARPGHGAVHAYPGQAPSQQGACVLDEEVGFDGRLPRRRPDKKAAGHRRRIPAQVRAGPRSYRCHGRMSWIEIRRMVSIRHPHQPSPDRLSSTVPAGRRPLATISFASRPRLAYSGGNWQPCS